MKNTDKGDTKNIETVLCGILSGIQDNNRNRINALSHLPEIQRATNSIQQDDCDDFYFALIYPISNTIDGLLEKELPESPDAQFLFKHSQFIENHYEHVIKKIEGTACCVDKARTIIGALARSLRSGQKIAFNYEQEYTFHLPKSVFKTHEEIMSFFTALQYLYYGNPDRFFEVTSSIYTRLSQKVDRAELPGNQPIPDSTS